MDQAFHVGIDVVRSARRRVATDLVMPVLMHWRLHWYGTPGASLLWQRRALSAPPERVLIIAPGTSCRRQLARPVEEHLFIHFRLDPAHNRLANRIWSLPIAAGLRAQLEELRGELPAGGLPQVSAPWRAASVVLAALATMPAEAWPARVTDPRISEIIRRIDLDLARPIDNRALARQLALSASGFLRLFTRQTGVTPQRYLAQRRLDLACRLLQGGGDPIEVISQRCGFCDRTYFTTTFSRAMGMPPAAYRRRMAGEE